MEQDNSYNLLIYISGMRSGSIKRLTRVIVKLPIWFWERRQRKKRMPLC